MTPFSAETLLHVADRLHELGQTDGADDVFLVDERAKFLATRCAVIAEWCRRVELRVSEVAVREIVGRLKRDSVYPMPFTHALLRDAAAEAQRTIVREASLALFFRMAQDRADYYQEPRKGWESIIERFPEATVHVEEMRKCFAVERFGAAVLHSVQIVEAGLIELGEFIDANDPKRGWTAVANTLRQIMRTPYEQRSEFVRRHNYFLEQVYNQSEALKTAWRNKVSHAHGYLRVMDADFAPDIAEEIMVVTRGFMRELAKGLPEPEVPF